MPKTYWKPHVTVATIVERKNNEGHPEYLMVHEMSQDDGQDKEQSVYNQPAGHLDEGENLLDAAVRETVEETAWYVEVTAYIGLYHYRCGNGMTYLRHGFAAKPVFHETGRELDEGIMAAPWMSYREITEKTAEMRSPTVIKMLDDYRAGTLYPLSILRNM